jgi:hypothetical protein
VATARHSRKPCSGSSESSRAISGLLTGAPQRLPNRRQNVILLWEAAGRVLLSDQVPSNPHSELASAALHEFWIDPEFLLDECRRTGSAGTIVSDFAESNADALHAISLWLRARGASQRAPSPKDSTGFQLETNTDQEQ